MDTHTTEEQRVIARARGGDRAAFGALVKLYQRRAYGAAYSLVRNRDDALDLAQEAFVRAFRAMKGFNPELPFYPWFYRILRNLCLNHLAKRKRRGESSLDSLVEKGFDVLEEGVSPLEALNQNDLKRGLKAALGDLSPEHREILHLRHFQDLSYSEIAECLAIPQGTVMSRLHGARKALRKVLESGQTELVNT